MNTDFASALIHLRGQKKLTQQDLGRAAGVSPSQISRYEAGMAMPRKTVMKKLADALGLTVDDLLSGAPLDAKVVELTFDVDFEKFGPIRCSLQFDRTQHRQLAEIYADLDRKGQQELLADFMVKGLMVLPPEALPLKGDSISSITARFATSDDYLDEISKDPVLKRLHLDSSE